MTLAMIDIDRVKQINTEFGPQTTERVLDAVCKIVMQSARNGDIITRMSGQRFMLLLPDTDARSATSAVERVRQQVEACRFERDGQQIAITVTCGVAQSDVADTVDTLISRADLALQEAKRYGRNRTFLHEGTLPAPVVPPQFDVEGRTLSL